MKLSFQIFCLTVYGHCLVLLTQGGVQNGCQIIICRSIMWLLKQLIFDKSCGKKSHTDIYVTQNDNSGGSKHIIPEIGQRSNEFKL